MKSDVKVKKSYTTLYTAVGGHSLAGGHFVIRGGHFADTGGHLNPPHGGHT